MEGCLFGPVDCGIAEVDQAVELILSRPHDDNVMDVAKSSGKLLFADLPPELRKTRIDQVVSSSVMLKKGKMFCPFYLFNVVLI